MIIDLALQGKFGLKTNYWWLCYIEYNDTACKRTKKHGESSNSF